MIRPTAWVFVVVLLTASICLAQTVSHYRPLPRDKEVPPPPKVEAAPPPTKIVEEEPKSPPPILFPAPPYPPPAPAVVDPRTGAWEQMLTPLEVCHEVTGLHTPSASLARPIGSVTQVSHEVAGPRIHAQVEVTPTTAGAVITSTPAVPGGKSPGRMPLLDWFYRYRHSGEGADVSTDAHPGEWNVVEVKPSR
jgi:hypothetical protein